MADGWRRWAMAIFPFAHRPTTDGGDRRGRPLMAKFATDSRDRRGRCVLLSRPDQATDGGNVCSWRDRFTRTTGATVATDSRDRRVRRGQLTRPTATDDHWARFSEGVGDSYADRFPGDVGDRWGRCGDFSDYATDRRGRPTRPTDGGDAWGQVGRGISRGAGARHSCRWPLGGRRDGGMRQKCPHPATNKAGRDIEGAKAGMQAGCALWSSRQRAEETKSQNAA